MSEDKRNPFNYPINPAFGKGTYRRRILLIQHNGYVSGDLEDCNHGFSVKVFHDNTHITAIDAQHHRIPYTTCGGAREPLMKLQGLPLGLTSQEVASQVNIRGNCTHWLDLTLLAIRHVRCKKTVRQYDIEVPDETDTATLAKIFRDGELILEWPIKDWVIQEPNLLAGKGIYKGFSAWANQEFTDEDLKEAAFALQKGYFVSRARRFDLENLAGESAKAHPSMTNACYTYSEPQASKGVRTCDSIRDFTDTPEELLKFL